jgi:uncharacterized protein
MIVVIDTNVLIQALSPRHTNAVISAAWRAGRFEWAFSTDILNEYFEVITLMLGPSTWAELCELLDFAETKPGYVIKVSPAYHFLAIPSDRDDDKFADCAITTHADFIINNDRHFRPLNNAGYKPQPISPKAFIERFLSDSPYPCLPF